MFDNTTPMPGESLESKEANEKLKAEQEAIANGENFNPNLTAEAAQQFENLGDSAPFAGESNGMPEVTGSFENLAEEVPFAGAALENAVGDMSNPAPANASQQEDLRRQYNSNDPVSEKFNQPWSAGSAPDLETIAQEVKSSYPSGAIESMANDMSSEANSSIADTNAAIKEQGSGNNVHDLSESAGKEAIIADTLSENAVDKIKAGDPNSAELIDEIEQHANQAEHLADQIPAAATANGTSQIEAQMANSVASQAIEQANAAKATVEAAQREFDSMNEEEKEETKAAAEAAEENGTSVETEKVKIEEEKKEEEAKAEEQQQTSSVQLDPGMLA